MGDEWADAIRNSDDAYRAMMDAVASDDPILFQNASIKYEQVEDERERATIRAGHFPAWPPRTDEGLLKVGLTRKQVDEILVKNSRRIWSAD